MWLRQMDIPATLASLRGSECINFRLIAGGSLILYLQRELVDPSGLTEWTLHIEPAWRIHHDTKPLMGSFDTPPDDNDVDQWLARLNKLRDQKIQDVLIGNPIRDLTISFTDGYSIQTFAHSINDGENWELRLADGRRLRMAPGDICSVKQSDATNGSHKIQ